MATRPSFFAELRRRNVLRAAALYIGAVWALGQGFAQLGPVIYLPDRVVRYFLVAAAIAFPFYLVFSWFYEWTPEGLKRESELALQPSTARRTTRRMDLAIIGVLTLAVVLLLTDRVVVRNTPAESVAPIAAAPEKSVAVLPLLNESGDSNNDYFTDGLSEQLISDLSRIEALRVIGRSSSFQFRGSTEGLVAIAERLGVAHLIEGTVRQSGERVRVVVELVRAADGSSVWSESYDRELKDIFSVQADIARAVAAALRVKLTSTTTASSDLPPSGNVEAYQAVLKARTLAQESSEGAIRQAIAYAETAVRLDPGYAFAHAALSDLWRMLGYVVGGEERRRAAVEARREADLALALAPDLAWGHLARGLVLSTLDRDYIGAQAELSRALVLAPGNGVAMSVMAQHLGLLGELEQATALMRRAIAADPLESRSYGSLALTLAAGGQLDEAEEAAQHALALLPGNPYYHALLTSIIVLRGDAATALRLAEQAPSSSPRAWLLALSRQLGADRRAADAVLRDFIAERGSVNPYAIAQVYALRREPDAVFEWLERALAAHDASLSLILSDPFLRVYRHDPRFAALCRAVGLPVPVISATS